MSSRANERVTSGIAATVVGTITAAPPVSTQTDTNAIAFSSAVSQIMLAANAARLGGTIYNNSDGNMYVALFDPASTAIFTLIVPPGFYYEIPFNYRGIVTAIWEVATTTGDAQASEFLP